MNSRVVLVALFVATASTGVGVATTDIVSIDGDELPVIEEWRHDTDPLHPDTDADGLDDSAELEVGSDPLAGDTDGDGLPDGTETNTHGTDPTVGDTDGDGLDDGAEVDTHGTDPRAADTDGDGLGDEPELTEHATDPTVADSDDDGLTDGEEVETYGTDPTAPDTDDDGLDDGVEIDDVGTDPVVADTDGDDLDDGREVHGTDTDPLAVDTDDDGLTDGAEIEEFSTNPTELDTDDDGLDDAAEVNELGTDPTKLDTDGDGLEDGKEAYNRGPLGAADPLRMDVFVEVDYMQDERPANEAIELVQAAYADAPIDNPDGSTGITLHVVVDDQLPSERPTYPEDRDLLYVNEFDRPGYGYHYGVAVDDARRKTRDVGGFARPGMFVFQTGYDHLLEEYDEYPVRNQARLFMHELGHSVGLSSSDYVGIDSERVWYEQYTSVMNYNAPSDAVGYHSGPPFDDWEHLATEIFAPSTRAATVAS